MTLESVERHIETLQTFLDDPAMIPFRPTHQRLMRRLLAVREALSELNDEIERYKQLGNRNIFDN